jgi:hypothetical protein
MGFTVGIDSGIPLRYCYVKKNPVVTPGFPLIVYKESGKRNLSPDLG